MHNTILKFGFVVLGALLIGTLGGVPVPDRAQAAGCPASTNFSFLAAGFQQCDFVTGLPSDVGNTGPVGFVFTGSGNVLVADYSASAFYSFPSTGGVAGAVSAPSGYTVGLTFGLDGKLYAAMRSREELAEVDPSTGAFVRTVATGFSLITGLATDPISGDIFATDPSAANPVVRVNPATGRATPYISSGLGLFASPDGLIFDTDGTLYVTGNTNIIKVDRSGVASLLATVPPGSDGLALGKSGTALAHSLFVNSNYGIISRIDMTQSAPNNVSSFASGGTRGDLMAVDSQGYLYVTQRDSIVRISPPDFETTPGNAKNLNTDAITTCTPKITVLIHGIALDVPWQPAVTQDSRSWGADLGGVAQDLKSYGNESFRWFNYSSNFVTDQYSNGSYSSSDTRQAISVSAANLETQVKAWHDHCPGSQFDIVAHSLGGVVVAYWAGSGALFGDSVGYIHAVLALESPLRGLSPRFCVNPGLFAAAVKAGGQAAGDLCDSDVHQALLAGAARLSTLTVLNRQDPFVNGCLADGLERADGLNPGPNGRVWDSFVMGSTADCLDVAHLFSDQSLFDRWSAQHSAPLAATSPCLAQLLPKLANAGLYDDTAPGISYSGTWRLAANSNRIHATVTSSSESGASFSFNPLSLPSKIVVITSKTVLGGTAAISICGGPAQDMDLRGLDARVELMYNITAPCSGPLLKISVVSHNLVGNNVSLDAIETWP